MVPRRSLLTGLLALPLALKAGPLLASFARGFRAHPTNRQTGLLGGGYSQALFGGIKFDTSGGYDAAHSVWFPPDGPGLARLSGQVWIVGGAGVHGDPPNGRFVVKLVKNDFVDVVTGIGTPDINLPGTVSLQFSGLDQYRRGDYYFVIVYADVARLPYLPGYFAAAAPDTYDMDDNPAHHFWCGEVVG